MLFKPFPVDFFYDLLFLFNKKLFNKKYPFLNANLLEKFQIRYEIGLNTTRERNRTRDVHRNFFFEPFLF